MGRKRVELTAEDKARHAAIREQFKHKPGIEEIRAMGYGPTTTMGELVARIKLGQQIKAIREAAGLSLADVAEKTGIDKAMLSRLENGRHDNPTVDTLSRIAKAIGRNLVFQFLPLEEATK
jgi:ribosome-binding protein aMBF1 (putative translation factor)